ncbi:MAG: helix-turn-helix transcriptional regulator [Phreatobacter sp.]|uniref:ArsR/SmtB family transcription factor n=1 Tax=Phreatobacter sp. TaxID=1966341 RepID=UPI001A54D2BB|nr:helix-turn-helix transcriptional regulator [Phreatobacter sp.]MBL8568230.1 helix-turn-helix transcriptional regulator [Phreatobacter sp.]
MVKYQNPELDRIFSALADPTRRALLAQLGDHEAVSVSELARPFAMSLPAVMKHLDVLSDAGLVTRSKTGRTVTCQLNAAPMEEAMNWLTRYQIFWTRQLDRLQALLEEDACQPSRNPSPPGLSLVPASGPASPSDAGSTPRRPRSTPRGRTPKG